MSLRKRRFLSFLMLLGGLMAAGFQPGLCPAQESAKRTPESLFAQLDKNRDGSLTAAELKFPRLIPRLDKNGDQRLSLQEAQPALQQFLSRQAEDSPPAIQVHRNVTYGPEAAHRLDIYPHPEPATAEQRRPVLIWIHGGGWRMGNKQSVQVKPQFAHREGMVFVSIGYRFVPTVDMDAIADDIARAIQWVHQHISEYGGDPQQMIVAGHSAGAHLAALVCVDPRYLGRYQLRPGDLLGCVPVDTAAYDAVQLIRQKGQAGSAIYRQAFGETSDQQARFSPLQQLNPEAHTPPMLILHCADRADARQQSRTFAEAASRLGIQVEVRSLADKTHATINRELGQPEDPGTRALQAFLERRLRTAPQDSAHPPRQEPDSQKPDPPKAVETAGDGGNR